MPSSAVESSLRVHEMRVVWRDTFIIDEPPGKGGRQPDFLGWARERLIKLPPYAGDRFTRRSDQPDPLRIIERASRNVARIGYDSILRFQFKPFRMTGIQKMLARLHTSADSLKQPDIELIAQEADERQQWTVITPMLVLHKAGVGMMAYLATFHNGKPGLTPEESIELVRLGISAQLLELPETWQQVIPDNHEEWSIPAMISAREGQALAVAGLRDISQIVGAQLSRDPKARQRGSALPLEASPSRPTGSATVVLVSADPMPTRDFGAFVAEHGQTLRGIGAMDNYYKERAPSVVAREMDDNLSSDSETAVYLLGGSELILFNNELEWVVASARDRMKLSSDDLVITYLYMHYEIMMEWTYLQDAILRAYIARLDKHVALKTPQRAQMIATLQGALADLIQYQENITPYATRIEFLEKARAHHKLEELGDRFERKQDMLLNYASEFHDYREARATEFLNYLATILTGASLAGLIVTLAGIEPSQTALYLGIHLVCVALALAILWVVQRFR